MSNGGAVDYLFHLRDPYPLAPSKSPETIASFWVILIYEYNFKDNIPSATATTFVTGLII